MGDKYKINLKDLIYFITGVGVFFTGSAIRYGVYSNLFLQQHCILFVAGLLLIWLLSSQTTRCDLSPGSFHRNGMYISVFVIIVCFLIVIFNSGTSKINSFISIILPIFVIAFRFKCKNDFLRFFHIWMKIMTVCVILMLATEIVDYISGFKFTQWMFNFTKVDSFGRMVRAGRPVSYMGHPLFSGELFLAFYILRHLLNTLQGKKDRFLWFAVCLMGCVLSQGRAATAIIVIAFVLFNLEWKKFKYIIILGVMLSIGYYLGLFDLIIERLFSSIANGDISTGRNSSIVELIQTNDLHLYALYGQTIFYDGSVTKLGMALEYPILSWAYSFGYIVSILISIAVFIYPLLLSIFRKQKVIFISLLMIILDVNTFTGLSSNGSKALLYYTFVCIILNVSNYLYYKAQEKIDL